MRLINADKLIRDVEDLPNCYNGFSDTYDKACIIGVIEEQSTADVPERNVGKWIEKNGILMCSECGDAWGTEQFDEVMSFNYCPNCGADMREETRDEL